MENIRDVLKVTSMGLITSNQRILNVCKKYPTITTEEFINTTNRKKLTNWGENSEKHLSQDLAIFILRELLKSHDAKKVIVSNFDSPAESLEEILGLAYPSLETLYLQRHDIWWKMILDRSREHNFVFRICDHLGRKWPDNYAFKKLSDYRFPTPRETLNIKKFGKKKLHSLILSIAWAALSNEDLPQPKNSSPYEIIANTNLNKMEKYVLKERYEDEHRRTLEDIGIRFSLTRERIRQLEANAIEKIRLLGLSEPVLSWLRDQAPYVWGLLSNDGGETITGIGDGRKDYKKLPGEVELALQIVDWDIDKLLRQVGECIAGCWYRKTPN
jgi:hypothetical protein